MLTGSKFQGITSKDQFKTRGVISEVSIEVDDAEISPEECRNTFNHWKATVHQLVLHLRHFWNQK
jgi:hypothetical protein